MYSRASLPQKKMIQLIHLVRKHPGLYNSQLREHKDAAWTRGVWEEISKELELPVKLVKEKWRHKRDDFRRKVKKVRNQDKTGEGSPAVIKGVFYEEMTFLEPYLDLEDREPPLNASMLLSVCENEDTEQTMDEQASTNPKIEAEDESADSEDVKSSSKLRAPFKSPLRVPVGESSPENVESLREELNKLKAKRTELDEKLHQLEAEGLKEEELQQHIKSLHEYNEMKDVGQMLLGKLAVERGVTTRELYSQYGIDLDD